MNQPVEQHSPAPEFVQALEGEVVAAFRRQSGFRVPPSARRRRRLRTVLTLAIGVAVGAGTVVASAQVQANSERDSSLTTGQIKRMMAALRLEALESEYQSTRKAVEAGARARDDLEAVQARVQEARWGVERAALDIEETRASGLSPRDELWAPLVKDRDFVELRLKLDAAISSARVELIERQRAYVRAKEMVGAVTDSEGEKLLSEFADAQQELNANAVKLQLRKQFLVKGIGQEALALRLQQIEANVELARAQRQDFLANSLLQRLRKQRSVGITTELEVKRAEVEVLESKLYVQRLERQYQLLSPRIKKD